MTYSQIGRAMLAKGHGTRNVNAVLACMEGRLLLAEEQRGGVNYVIVQKVLEEI